MAFSITYYDNIRYHRMDFINRDLDFFGNGVVATNDFPLTFPSTPNMTATIGQGRAWVDGYRIANDSNPVTINFLAADPTNARIDIIQLGHDDINSTYNLQVKKGVAAASPVEPNADAGFVKLYAINVAANATSISASNIIDRRGLVPLNVSATQISLGGSAGTNQNNTFNAGYTQTFNGPVFANSTLTTAHSTLDDGKGNATFGGTIYANGNLVSNGNSSFHVVPSANGDVGFTNSAATQWGLYVQDNGSNPPSALTYNNTLDDGTGGMSVKGNLSVLGAMYNNADIIQEASGTATSTANESSYAIYQSASWWNSSLTTPAAQTRKRYSYANPNGEHVFGYVNESGTETDRQLVIGANGSLNSIKNQLDDGAGNAFFVGEINAKSMAENWIGGLRLVNANGYNYIESFTTNEGNVSAPLMFTGANGAAVEIQTKNNILDDGSGNATFNGQIKTESSQNVPALLLEGDSVGWASGLQLNNTTASTGHKYGMYSGSDGTFHLTDETAAAPRMTIDNVGNTQFLYGSLKSIKNTLDDGNGFAIFNNEVTIMSAQSGTSLIDSPPLHLQAWSGSAATGANIKGWHGGGWFSSDYADSVVTFLVQNSGNVSTKNNTLDNGSGSATFNGLTTINNHLNMGASGTATSTNEYWANPLYFYGSHWNGTAATTTSLWIQGDNLGGLNIGSNGSGANVGLITTDNKGNTTIAGSLRSAKNTLDDGSGLANLNTVLTRIGTASGGQLHHELMNGSSLRIGLGLLNTEGGSNSGSDFSLFAYDDTGNYLSKPLTITRSNGALKSLNNTLDDGSGNMSISSHISMSDSNEHQFKKNNANADHGFYINDTGFGGYDWKNGKSILSYTSANDTLQFGASGPTVIKTGSNTLDDGTGQMTITGAELFINPANGGTAGIEMGSTTAATTPYIDFHSSGAANDYNARIVASGGSTTTTTNGDGLLNLIAGTLAHNGTSIPNLGDFSNSLSGNGYQKLPNGLIIQWGRVASVPNATMTNYPLPISFPNLLLQATVGILNADGRTSWNPTSTSQIGLYQDSGAAQPMSYIVIGY